MTDQERELIAALTAANQRLEFVAEFGEQRAIDFETPDGERMAGAEYARGLRNQIEENRGFIERVEKQG